MKKLIIVSTRASIGKGGISTALQGYINGLNSNEVDFEMIESHAQTKNMIITWLISFLKVTLLALKYRSGGVFWFHSGPWLSTLRKSSLAIFPRIFGCETIVHIHSPTFNTYLTKNLFSKILIKISLMPYKKIIVLTPWWKSLLIKHNVKKEILISPNPNNQHYCDIAQQCLITPKKINQTANINILSMSRLVKGKGIELVIKALKELPETFSLTIAGDGPCSSEFIQLVKSLDLEERVVFTGWINGEQKEKLLFETDIFCLPSTYDSFGMVFIEAMAFELPVVAYGWGPIADVVTADVGECCNEAEVKNVVKAIVKVYENITNFQGKGPKKVLKNYTPELVMNNILNLLK